jgi:NAD-dependent dihydropyrimidine dehydrogenase PreA subunit
MELEMLIHEDSCRGCKICVDICPTDVLIFNEETKKASVKIIEDCIACLSCSYACPSKAIEHNNVHHVQNFYRNNDFLRKIERFV